MGGETNHQLEKHLFSQRVVVAIHDFPWFFQPKEPVNAHPELGMVTLQEWFHKIRAVKSCPASD